MTKAETKLRRLSKKFLDQEEKPLSGKDLGELLLVHLALMIQDNNKKKSDSVKKSLISKEKIMELSGSLPNNQKKVFNTYAALHNAVVRGLKEETIITSRFFHAFYKLQGYQKDIINYEDKYEAAGNRPMIITSAAYDALVYKIRSARYDKDISYYSLFFYTLKYFLMLEDQPLLLPKEIRTELDALKEEKMPYTDDPSETTAETKPDIDSVEAARLIYQGKTALIKHIKAAAPQEDISRLEAMEENELIDYIGKNGGTAFLKDPALKPETDHADGSATKYDLLRDHVKAFDMANGKPEKAAARAALKAFKEDLPGSYKEISRYMCRCIPKLSEVKALQQTKTLFKASELIDYEPVKIMLLAKEPEPREFMELFDDNDPDQFLLKAQIGNGGISVLDFVTPGAEKSLSGGIYTADTDAIDPYDIDRFSDPKIDYYGDVQFQKRCMFAAVCECFLYNAYLKVALDGLKIDYMDAAFIDTERIEYAIEQYNNCCYKAYSNITGTPKERAKRRTVIKNAFSPVSVEKIREFADRTDRLKGAFELMESKGHITEYFEKTREIIDELINTLEKGAFG